VGRFEEAIAHGKRAIELDPLTALVTNNLGWSYIHARQYDEAIAACQQSVKIDPEFYFNDWCLGYAYLYKGMHEQALAAYQHAVELEPHDLQLKSDFALAYAKAGEKAEAESILEEFKEKAQLENVPPYAFAVANIAVGDLDSAFAWLDKMYAEHIPWLVNLNVEERWDSLRGDPRFHELLRKVGFTAAQIDAGDALARERG
jgi:adenylate cyclase